MYIYIYVYRYPIYIIYLYTYDMFWAYIYIYVCIDIVLIVKVNIPNTYTTMPCAHKKNPASVCCSTLRHRIISSGIQIVFQDTMKHKHSGTNAAHVANKVPQLLKTRSLAFYMKRLLMDGLPCIALAFPDALSHEVFLRFILYILFW